MRQTDLVERVKAYDPDADEALLNKAYVYAMTAHGKQFRASGDPYFAHPLEVAAILTDLKLDVPTIVTALLHDTIEDTLVTYEDIKENFGEEIANLVDGVTKLSQLEVFSERTKQAENFRKLMLAITSDIRVLLVKLADRLHNMRTLGYHRQAGQAPPHRPGDGGHLCAAGRAASACRTCARSWKTWPSPNSIPKRAIPSSPTSPAWTWWAATGSAASPTRSSASWPSTAWRPGSMAAASGPFRSGASCRPRSSISSSCPTFSASASSCARPTDCYRALGIIHTNWQMVPERFKDFISTPKPNGYRSIHTTVIGPEKQRVEIQIRTQEMHDIAERGVAAHWRYREHVPAKDRGEVKRAYGWLRDMVDLLERGDSAEEVLEHSRLHMYQDQVFCFTPKGDLISLPRGATPIDFAYAVHTDLGNTAVGAKVNGKHVPLHTPLEQWRPGRDHHHQGSDAVAACGSSSWSPAGRGPKSAASCAMPSATSM